ncbi:MAG: DUF3078 domain-containing protein [Chitinophagaceae bacterium]
MKKIFLLCSVFSVMLAIAQDETVKDLKKATSRSIKKDPNDTIPKAWKKGGLYGLNISQGSLSNWAAGGEDFSLSINSLFSLFAFYKDEKHSWDNAFDFNLGFVKTTSLGNRKNDDRIDLLSKYGYALNSKLNLAGLFNFRSQLFKGYSYDDTGGKTLSSAFLSPAYILISPGLDYKPNADLSIFVSPLTARWAIVKDDTLSARGLYGVDPGKHSNGEFGAFASVNYQKEFNKNVTYKTRLDLFSNYKRNPQNVDLYFTNILNVKLSKIISVSWSVDMIYDDDTRLFGKNDNGAALQLKSLVGIGILAKF